MTPDRRLDQLEPLMADSLQKIDRLIAGQGQILEVATRAEQKADTTAKGVADLTISTQKQFDQLRTGQDQLKDSQEQLRAGQEQLKDSQEQLRTGQEQLSAGQEQLSAGQEQLRDSQDQLSAGQEQLKAGQELILQILREKLR